MGRVLARVLMWVMAVAAGLYASDWLVWQGRMLRGRGYGVVSVDRIVVAPLKNNKEEYYPDGRVEVRCTQSALPQGFPQAGGKPCWWIERHPVDFDR